MTKLTPFEQQIVNTLEPMYQELCRDVEAMLDELPPGSHIGSTEDGYEVVVVKPAGEARFCAAGVAGAYTAAMNYVTTGRIGE